MAIVDAFVLLVGTALVAWTLRVIRAGVRDATELSGAPAVPFPARAADWPELRLDAVVFDPDGSGSVLLLARWPSHPDARALLVLDLEFAPPSVHRLLMQWRDIDARLTPAPIADCGLALRRRRTNDTVVALVVRESHLGVGELR